MGWHGRRQRTQRTLIGRSVERADAFADFYATYAQDVNAYFARRTLDADLALEMTAETFSRAFEHRRQFRGSNAAQEQAWLYAIARNLLARYHRRGKLETEAMKRLGVQVRPLSDIDLERIEELAGVEQLRRHVHGALDRLPQAQAWAVEQRVIHERGYEDIAAELDVSQDVIRARVSRGLRSLADALVVTEVLESGP